MKFYIINNTYDESLMRAKEIREELLSSKKWIEDETEPDYIFVIGGDGTFLSAVNKYNNKLDKIIFYPIKSGGIGFYTNHNNIDAMNKNSTDLICVDKCNVEELSLLEMTVDDNDIYYSVNEIKILNDLSPQKVEVYIDDEKLETFRGSGLAFSTPSGTTGFMKSIGGAIIYPKLKLYEMQEISPVSTVIFKTINSPIVFSEQIVTLIPTMKEHELKIIIDAKKIINKFNKLEIKISDKKIKLIRNKKQPTKTEILRDIFVINK